MGHRILVFLVSACLSIAASQVNALGLGDIKLKSSLNEPLYAEIELLQLRELTEEEIIVELASNDDFERIGVDKTYFLTGLKFKVDLEASGGPIIIATTKKPVKEPFLNFVIQTLWPSGKLLREYTLLMDLPVFAEGETNIPVDAPSSPYSQSSYDSEQVIPKTNGVKNPRSSYGTQQSSTSRSSYAGPAYDGESYRVQRNDTLWEIAEQVRPSGAVTIHQTMIALQHANPEAFINNNINLLKSGQILRVPDESEVIGTSQQRAIQEVATQNAQWSGGSSAYNDESGPQLEGSRSISDYQSTSDDVEGRLKLSSPDEVYGSNEGRSSGGSADSSSDAIENELSITLEQLGKTQKENSDLRSKVQSLEDQINTMERMLEVSSESLRALELSTKKSELEAEQVEDSLEHDSLVEDDTADSFESDPLIDSDAESLAGEEDSSSALDGVKTTLDTVGGDESSLDEDALSDELSSIDDPAVSEEDALAEEAVVESTPAPAAKPPVSKVVTRAPEPTIVDMLMDNVMYIALGVVALIVLIVLVLRGRSSEDDEFDDFLQAIDQDASVEESSDADSFEQEVSLEDVEEPEDFLSEDAHQETQAEEDTSGEQQTEDVVAEADIYIAYGKFDQAEEMLVSALEKSPQDEAVQLKLLEVYSSQDNVNDFDPHFAKLKSFATADAISRAEKLRSSIADAPAFDESAYNVPEFSASETEVNDELDVSLDIEETSFTPESDEDEFTLDLDSGSESLAENTSLGDDLDLDLDLDVDTSSSSDDISLDLDMDRDDDDTSTEVGGDLSMELDDSLVDESTSVLGSEEELSLALDTEDGESESSSSLDDLTLELDEQVDSQDSDLVDGDIDFNLGDLDESESLDNASDATVVFDVDDTSEPDEVLSLDLDLDESDESEALSIDIDLGEDDLSEEELAVDFDLVTEDENLSRESSEEQPEELDDLDGLSFDLSDDDASSTETTVMDSVDLVEENLELDDSDLEITEEQQGDADDQLSESLTVESSEELLSAQEPTVEESTAIEPFDTEDDVTDLDDLEFGSEADLSALDDELEEMTSDLDVDDTELDLELESVSDAASLDDLDGTPTLEIETVEDDIPGIETSLDEDDAPAEKIAAVEDEDFQEGFVNSPTSEFAFAIPEVDPEGEDDGDLEFLSDADETATKLDLARAYIDMGDTAGAKDIVREILKEGNDQQKLEAETLLAKIDS